MLLIPRSGLSPWCRAASCPCHAVPYRADLQTIVLPESLDRRVLAAAADVTQRGLAKVVLLGDPAVVQASRPQA
jgi:phosphotransacetylase